MLNIDIIHGNPDESLKLRVNGFPSNGNNKAKRGWSVHWRVKPHSNVDYIEAITIKTGPGAPPSTDIFSSDPPAAQNGSNNKHWKGTVNSSAIEGEEYNYDIKWKQKGDTKIKTFDPKISIRPSLTLRKIIKFILLTILSLFTLNFFRRKKKNR